MDGKKLEVVAKTDARSGKKPNEAHNTKMKKKRPVCVAA